jgi:ABC-type nitrate/sulfonate/bicarbonate transport system substrate-binding protein
MTTRCEQITVGTFTPSLLIDLARSSGALRQAGLDVVETLVPSSPSQFASLEAGEFDVVFTSPDNVLAYHFLSANPLQRNIPLHIVSGIDRGLGLSLCVAPDIADVGDLKAKVVAVDVPQSGFAFVAYALLDRAGLTRADYLIESLGSTPRRADALIAGSCAATVLNAGNELRAVGAGCSNISPVSDLGPYIGTVLATLASSDRAANDMSLRFAETMLTTIHDIIAGEREADVIETAIRLLNLNEQEAQDHYACLRHPRTGFVEGGRVDRASLETLIDLRRAYSPTTELDAILDEISSVVLWNALEQ